ncbi:gamma-glutamylcyclotransferase family protein [Paraburkholderia sp. GAS42]|jgi:gamma-glutamylcyclotransferase (GGCT)/AIG2-like uncharacterized protein YtfP|uniref:gamma-glutamylcyclotransferase family protein n=1 Tax=Paraburkholderia sp. GAS42 TaxID=3035135 RepID=UPI003D1B5AFA
MQNVFVYGTLRAGEVNDISAAAARHDIAPPTLLGTAAVNGRLYDFSSYPGLVVDDRGVPVVGDVYEIDDELVAVLDEIEQVYPGVEGLFRGRDVTIEVDGVAVACRIYPVTKEAVVGLKEIASGDWVAHRRGR